MKVLLVSRFPPSLGGLETMGVLIAREWASDKTLEVKVVTDVAGEPMPGLGCELIRCPGMRQLHQLYGWSDAVFFNHCYLKLAAPLLWQRKKPYVVSMSGTLEDTPESSPGDKARRLLLRRMLRGASANIAACEYVKTGNGVPATVITNPYDSTIYHGEESGERPRHFLFGGRINQAAKGCFDLLEAFAACRQRTGRDLTLSVAGDGPDLPGMKQRVAAAGLESAVEFLGVLHGRQLAGEMRRHQVIVVPSRYQEPIGIICLEGIACGCIAIGSSGGGLGETVGPCGFTFPNGDVESLTEAMIRAVSLDDPGRQALRQNATGHLATYEPSFVAGQYLAALRKACHLRISP